MLLKTAKELKIGDTVYHKQGRNADGTAKRFKITSIKLWKRSPTRIEIGLKRGLREFHKLNEYQINQITDKEPIHVK